MLLITRSEGAKSQICDLFKQGLGAKGDHSAQGGLRDQADSKDDISVKIRATNQLQGEEERDSVSLLGPRWERQDTYFSLPGRSCLGGLPRPQQSAISSNAPFWARLPVRQRQGARLKDSNRTGREGKRQSSKGRKKEKVVGLGTSLARWKSHRRMQSVGCTQNTLG